MSTQAAAVARAQRVAARRSHVAHLTALGWTMREIAEELGVSRQTISVDRRAINQATPPPQRGEEWPAPLSDATRATEAELLALLGTPPGDWRDEALCRQTGDPEMFFPPKGGSTREAKSVCNGNPAEGVAPCPVRAACLKWALDTDQRFGVWGGVSERDRFRLRRAS